MNINLITIKFERLISLKLYYQYRFSTWGGLGQLFRPFTILLRLAFRRSLSTPCMLQEGYLLSIFAYILWHRRLWCLYLFWYMQYFYFLRFRENKLLLEFQWNSSLSKSNHEWWYYHRFLFLLIYIEYSC